MDVQGELAAVSTLPVVQPVENNPRVSNDGRISSDFPRSRPTSTVVPHHITSSVIPEASGATPAPTHAQASTTTTTTTSTSRPPPTLQLLKTSSDDSLIQSVAGGPIDKRAADAITAHTHARNIEAGIANRNSTIEAGPAGTTASGPAHAPEKAGDPLGVARVVREVSPQETADALELDRLLAGLKEDALGAVQLGEDGVMRSFTADREIIDAVGLSPRLIQVWFARMPPGLREMLGEEEFAGVDGTLVPRENMFSRNERQLPPPVSKGTLELRKMRIAEREKEDERMRSHEIVRETTAEEEKKGVEVRNAELPHEVASGEASASGIHREAGQEEGVPGSRKSRKGSREKCGFFTAAKRRIF